MTDLNRFISAQSSTYLTALSEVKAGRKQSHWMWYIFPQILGLGMSETSRYYGIKDIAEAKQYFENPVLGSRLIEISAAVLDVNGKTANQIFGSPDDLKLKSSMTLFAQLANTDPIFEAVLQKYFDGSKDDQTLQLLK